MSKNIVKIELEKMGIAEDVVDDIMGYHGGLDAMLPDWDTPEELKRCLRRDNWNLEFNENEEDEYLEVGCKITVNINKNNVKSVHNESMNVYYKYSLKDGFMHGIGKITGITDNIILIDDFINKGKFKFVIDNFVYLRMQHRYKTKYLSRITED